MQPRIHDVAYITLQFPTGVMADVRVSWLDPCKTRKITVLFVEHDMEVVSRFAQRVLAFYDGRIIADAAPEIALTDPEVKRYVVGGELHRMDEQQGAANA